MLLSLIDAAPPVLFGGLSTPILNQHYGFDTAYMSDIEDAKSSEEIRQILVDKVGFKHQNITDEDTEVVKWVCKQVATRAARLSAIFLSRPPTLGSTGKAMLLSCATQKNPLPH